jgi:hypothetical protein
MEQSLERVAVGQVAEAATALLADPAGGGGLAVVRAVLQNQELNLRQVLCRQSIHVDREMGDCADGLEERLHALFEMARLVRLIADQDERTRL